MINAKTVERYLRVFQRGVDEAGDWYFRDDLTPNHRTKMATSQILRTLNKIHKMWIEEDQDGSFGDYLREMYLQHVGRRTIK